MVKPRGQAPKYFTPALSASGPVLTPLRTSVMPEDTPHDDDRGSGSGTTPPSATEQSHLSATSGTPDRPRAAPAADATAGDRRWDRVAERVSELILNRSGAIVLVFVLLTGVFFVGLTNVGFEAGDEQFTEGTASEQALEDIEENFEQRDRDTGGTTAFLVVDPQQNVLSEPTLLRMLRFQELVENRNGLRVESTSSPASLVARQLDPAAETPGEQARVIEETPQGELAAAIADTDFGEGTLVSTDFTPASASADVAQISISYATPPTVESDFELALLEETQLLADSVDGFDTAENILLFGDAIVQQENNELLIDSSAVVFPASLFLILFFLTVAYRDPFDLGVGLIALLMAFVWTFGFMGLVGIPFAEPIITVFALILAVGIDFGIHVINRYREERTAGAGIDQAMLLSTRQLLIAFAIVAVTTAFSFAANIASDQTQEFGIVAAVGVIFILLIFGIFVPAAKVSLDRFRAGRRIPSFGSSPLLGEESVVTRGLSGGVSVARGAPAVFLAVMLLLGTGVAVYGTGVDAEFDQEVFFPEEERVEQYQELPPPLGVDEYVFIEYLDYLEEDFDAAFQDSVTIYIEDRGLRTPGGLSPIDQTLQDPPDVYEADNRRAVSNSILDIIDRQAEVDPEFAALVDRYDATGNGVPDRELETIYDELFDSPAGDDARDRLTNDYTATRVAITVDADAEQEDVVATTRAIAEDLRFDAVATGTLVVFEDVAEETTETAVVNLALAFVLTAVTLLIAFRQLEGRAVYGVLTLVPVVLAVALLLATMRYLDIALSPITAPILSVSIGLGVDYTVHFMHRFIDEYTAGDDVFAALSTTVRGTGGALTGSMITTVSGLGVLYLALIPVLVEFGLLLALGVFYAWLLSLVVLPSAIVTWDRFRSEPLPAAATDRVNPDPTPEGPRD